MKSWMTGDNPDRSLDVHRIFWVGGWVAGCSYFLYYSCIFCQDWNDGASFHTHHRIWYTLSSSAVQYVTPLAVIIILYYKIYIYLNVSIKMKCS